MWRLVLICFKVELEASSLVAWLRRIFLQRTVNKAAPGDKCVFRNPLGLHSWLCKLLQVEPRDFLLCTSSDECMVTVLWGCAVLTEGFAGALWYLLGLNHALPVIPDL